MWAEIEKKRSILGRPRLDPAEHVDRTPKCRTWSRSGVGSRSGLGFRLKQKELIALLHLFTCLFIHSFIHSSPFMSTLQSDSHHSSINNHSKVFSRNCYPGVICTSREGHWSRLSAGLLLVRRQGAGGARGSPGQKCGLDETEGCWNSPMHR